MFHTLTHDEIEHIKSRQAYLIDVRSAPEVAEQRVPYAMHWDVQQMVEGRFPDIPKNAPVFVFCRTGNRSSLAQRLLGGAGFTDSHDMGGVDSIPDEIKSA